MCGRYILTSDTELIARLFDAEVAADLQPRYNIAPTQPVPIVRTDRETQRRRLELVHWGLIPHWAKDPTIGNRLINARAETAASKPAYRSAMRYRRCLLPTDGFYEWKKLPGNRKQPHLIRMADEQPFGLAGLWEHWQDPAGNEIDSCTILTTDANEMMAELHQRMPVVIDPQDYTAWLDPANQDARSLEALLRPYPAERMMYQPVTTRVNNPRHEGPDCIEPVTGPEPGEDGGLFI